MQLPIPGIDQPIGLGDVVKKVTSAIGIKPCGSCNKRAQKLNMAVTLVPAKEGAAELPAAHVGQWYETGLPGVVVGGSIPPGLEFEPQMMRLAGVPTQAGKYGLVIGKQDFSIEVQG